MQHSIITKVHAWALAVGLAICAAPTYSAATIVDNRSWSGTSCGAGGTVGSGDCYGATYSLVVDDRGDANATTFSAALTVAIGTYTGGMTYIGAVDFKPGDVTGSVLTAAPGSLADWQTSFTGGQAAGNCLNGVGGFLCSYDKGLNTRAPTTNNATYGWAWDFTLNGAYTFGHFGVNYTVADDSCSKKGVTSDDCKSDGQNLSIDAGGIVPPPPGGRDHEVPEPSTFILLGAGLIGFSLLRRRATSRS